MSEIRLNEVDVQRLNLQQGEVLVVKVKGGADRLSMADLDSLKRGFQNTFPNNKVVLLALPEDSTIDLTVAQSSEYPDVKPLKEPCSVVNYCDSCNCGKKAMAEQLGIKKGE